MLVLHVVYSEPPVNSSTTQDLHFPVLSRTLSFHFQDFPEPNCIFQDFPGPGKSRTFQDVWEPWMQRVVASQWTHTHRDGERHNTLSARYVAATVITQTTVPLQNTKLRKTAMFRLNWKPKLTCWRTLSLHCIVTVMLHTVHCITV